MTSSPIIVLSAVPSLTSYEALPVPVMPGGEGDHSFLAATFSSTASWLPSVHSHMVVIRQSHTSKLQPGYQRTR
jgi:hypothetical protein